ncbi:MAG TPA: dihydropteroate synthase [Candidatus Binatus sp.]|uniref:dihydropteroate synthase n=1 Tax=Candidatus Binatus sp. TaxID=2811406 RepID=UPI002B464E49|nr:dihydropteroate synthase [Candidatus Binatus sp.]HKN14881.1 dihydropteroate synthase [Candidatus Binatus sp.]
MRRSRIQSKSSSNDRGSRKRAPQFLPAPANLKLADGRIIKFPAVMGVLNVTPDSFSDGGRYLDPNRAVEHALAMEAAGADVIDVGGESSRPVGAVEIPVEVELARVTPVLARLGKRLRVPISIDTRRAEVARVAFESGAAIINDITALGHDCEMAPLAARTKCAVVLMHMRGGPANHIAFARYRDVVREVVEYLDARARFAATAGVARARIIVDPGLGFAKTAQHNLKLLAALPDLLALGYPVLVGASRKTFVARIAGAGERELEFGTAAANALAIAAGASIVRVHDVGAGVAAMRMAAAMTGRDRRFRRDA